MFWCRRAGAEEIYGLGDLNDYEKEGLKVRIYLLFIILFELYCNLIVHTNMLSLAVPTHAGCLADLVTRRTNHGRPSNRFACCRSCRNCSRS